MQKVAHVLDEKGALEKQLRAAAVDIAKERGLVSKADQRYEASQKEVLRLNMMLDEARLRLGQREGEVDTLERDVSMGSSRLKQTERSLAKVSKDKSSLEKKVELESDKARELTELVRDKKLEASSLETDLRKLHAEAVKMRNVISVLERDRERLQNQVEMAEKDLAKTTETLRERDTHISDLEQREKDLTLKLRGSQSAFESQRMEKNQVIKQLGESKEETGELRRKEKVQTNQIEQLKEELHNKERGLIAEQFEKQSVEKRLEHRSAEVEQMRKIAEEMNANVGKQANEIADLHHTIHRLDAEALAQKRAYDQVVTERDILGTQLIRRNDELALLYEKLAIQTATLGRGEQHYKERLDDIRVMKIKIADLKREITLASAAKGTTAELRQEVARLQREVLQERTRVKGLSDELENPLNVHRWRKLEGSDPESFELILKIQTLQKRLIAKTEEVVEKDMQLADKEKQLADMQAALSRQPGPELAEQVSYFQQLLEERTRQLKALAGEVNMYQAQIGDFRLEIDRLGRELMDTKKAYYEVKKKERSQVTAALAYESSGSMSPHNDAAMYISKEVERDIKTSTSTSSGHRFVGGGFNIQRA
jgi:chromosome segregation ATPase